MPSIDESLSGRVLTAEDSGYDAAREVWNARFESRPDAIVRCGDASQVADAIRHAKDHDLRLTVKAGGHDYAGRSANVGGLLVDLSPMGSISVDAEGRRARVGAGVTWGGLDRETQAFGLAAPGVTVSTVGVTGSTLGGGEGWLLRKHGLALDSLLSAEVVTASGDVVAASEDENSDLFWALRGGGGSFGVVTSLEFALHEVGPEVLAGQIIYPADDAAALLRFYRDYALAAPDELACYLFFLRIPPIPAFPEAFHGQLAVDFVVAYMGSVEEGESHVAPLRALGDPILEAVAPQPYVELQQSFDAGMPKGQRWYTRAHYLGGLPDEAIDAWVEHLDPFPGPFTVAYIGAYGGAVARVEPTATAFPHRGAAFGMHVLAGWTDPSEDEPAMAWTRAMHAAMAPFAEGVYVNLLGEDEAEGLRPAYGQNYERLATLKRKWDPENLFRSTPGFGPRG